MKTNKALLSFDGKPVISIMVDKLKELFNEIIIVTNESELYDLKKVRYVNDKINNNVKCSLIGIYSGVYEANSQYSLVLPCDMPFISLELIKYMVDNIGDSDVITPYINDFYEPLHSIYNKTCLPYMTASIADQQYKITDLFKKLKIKRICDEEIRGFDEEHLWLMNLNSPEDYEKAKKKWGERYGTSKSMGCCGNDIE